MKTKSFFILLFFLLATFVFSCGDDDKKVLSFKNQDVQGEMFGDPWEYADGSATPQERDGQEMIGVTLYASFDDDDCKGSGNETGENEVSFSAPRAIGVYKLKNDPDYPMLHVAMVHVDSDGPGPEIALAYEGSIEVLTISETEVTGRVVARIGDHMVNGNFEVQFCIVPEGESMRVKSH